jgi:hypothetical protein
MNHLYTPNNTPTFAIHVENAVFPIEIEWYEKFALLGNEDGEERWETYVTISIENGKLQIHDTQGIGETIPIDFKTPIYETLIEKYGVPSEYENALSKEELTFNVKGNNYEVRVYLDNLRIINPTYQWNKLPYTYVSGYALVKKI